MLEGALIWTQQQPQKIIGILIGRKMRAGSLLISPLWCHRRDRQAIGDAFEGDRERQGCEKAEAGWA
jgi:hypothetical protein